MEDVKSPFEVLDRWHHLRKWLHFWEYIDKWLGVVQSRQNFLRERFLNVVHCFFLCLSSSEGRIFLGFQTANCPLKRVNQVLVLTFNLSFLLYTKSSKCFASCFCLCWGFDAQLSVCLYHSLDLGLWLRLSLNRKLRFRLEKKLIRWSVSFRVDLQ